MRRPSRLAELWLIAVAFCAVSVTLWGLGRAFDLPLLSFTGLMTIASTFIPMPADAYVVNASQHLDALTIGLVGGAVNAIAVLGERMFVDRLAHFPVFARVQKAIGTNKYVEAAEEHMFFGLIIAAASPLPFEVFRFVACARRYNRLYYAIATFIGRGGRYFALAKFGGVLAGHGLIPWVVAILVGLFVIGLAQSIWRARRLDRQSDDQPQGEVGST